MPNHETVPVWVLADVDVGVADMVRYLNTIPGVRTFSSCQGTLGEGGPHPYRAQVGVTWKDRETFDRLCTEFDFSRPDNPDRLDTDPEWTPDNCWGYFHPREG